MNLKKIGGYSSLVIGFLMIVFIVIGGFVLNLGSDLYEPIKGFDKISASLNSYLILQFGLLLCGLAYIPIVLALRERMQDSAPNIMRIAVIGVAIICALWFASAFIGIIGMPLIVSSNDTSAFWAAFTVGSSLGTAGDFTVGVVLLLIGCVALKFRLLQQILSYLFVLKGVVMILEIVFEPMLIVGLLLGLIFYPWLGIVLLRSKS